LPISDPGGINADEQNKKKEPARLFQGPSTQRQKNKLGTISSVKLVSPGEGEFLANKKAKVCRRKNRGVSHAGESETCISSRRSIVGKGGVNSHSGPTRGRKKQTTLGGPLSRRGQVSRGTVVDEQRAKRRPRVKFAYGGGDNRRPNINLLHTQREP